MIETTERSAVPFLGRVSTLLRERQAITSWNNAADTVAIAPIIAARIVSESPMQILCDPLQVVMSGLRTPDCTASQFIPSRMQLAVLFTRAAPRVMSNVLSGNT